MEPLVPHNLVIAMLSAGNPHPLIKGWLKSSATDIMKGLTNLLHGFMFNGVLTFPVRAENLQEAEQKLIKLAQGIFRE